jgi:hypothetical protein
MCHHLWQAGAAARQLSPPLAALAGTGFHRCSSEARGVLPGSGLLCSKDATIGMMLVYCSPCE